MTVPASEQHNMGVKGAARSFAALRMTVSASEQHNTGVKGAARSFAALRMTGLSFLPSSGLLELMRGLG